MKALLLAALVPLSALAEPIAEPGWVDLLADNSTDQWQSGKSGEVTEAWSLNDGVLHLDKSNKKGGGHITTKKIYFDFELKFEWKISPEGNSGVKYRTTDLLGYEFQVIDDASKAARKDSHRAGCLYDLVPAPAGKTVKAVGEWNRARIVAKGKRLEHWLNGVKLVDIEIGSDDWNERFGESKYRDIEGFAAKPGPLLLQDHGNDVWFRNMLLKEL